MGPSRVRALVGIFALGVVSLAPPPSAASEVVVRRFGPTEGLPISDVRALAMDERGYLWIGMMGGLARFDGARIEPWAEHTITRWIRRLAVDRDGRVFAAEYKGGAWEIEGRSARPLDGPAGPFSDVEDLAVDGDGRLWVAGCSGATCGLFRRDRAGGWIQVSTSGGEARRVRPQADGSVLVVVGPSTWKARGDAPLVRVHTTTPDPRWGASAVIDATITPDGALWALEWNGRLQRLGADGTLTTPYEGGPRAIGLVVRHETVWVSYDDELVGVRPTGAITRLGPAEGLTRSGPILVDGEGALWLGGFSGLLQVLEPDTEVWRALDGLPNNGARFGVWSAEGPWISTWAGLGRIRAGRAETLTPYVTQVPCVDPDGGVWIGEHVGAPNGPAVHHFAADGSSRRAPLPVGQDWMQCAVDPRGGVWIATRSGVWWTATDPLHLVEAVGPPDIGSIGRLALAPDGSVWVAAGPKVCRSEPSPAPDRMGWSCEAVAAGEELTGLIVLPDGRPLLSSALHGLWERGPEGWRSVDAFQTLALRSVGFLSASPRGGVWMPSGGAISRVMPDPGTGAWEIVEEVGLQHGVPSLGANVAEAPTGDLLLATSEGVAWVPRSVRDREARAPAVRIVEIRVDERVRPLTDRVVLGPAETVEVAFAPGAMRGPARHRSRVLPGGQWAVHTTPDTVLSNMAPGVYTLEVQASVDGRHWTEPERSARLVVEVPPPWHTRWWALVAASTLPTAALAVGFAIVRLFARRQEARLAAQRDEILHHLHDEFGSLLGAASVQSDFLVAQPDGERAAALRATVLELHDAARYVYWVFGRGARRAKHEPPAPLREQLETVLRQSFPRGAWGAHEEGHPRLVIRLPDVLPARWTVPQRNAVMRVVREAVANARKHAEARSVSIEVDGRLPWRVRVVDDGVGFSEERAVHGFGLESMRARAASVGGTVTTTSAPGAGTTVELVFPP